MLEFFSRIMEEQEEPIMKELTIIGLSSQSIVDPTEEEKRFINAVVRSGLT